MLKSLSSIVIAPVPVEAPTPAEPISNARYLFIIGGVVVIFLLLAVLASRMLRKKR